MSWDLSSEEVIVDKLENQQRTIFAFSAKIKDLESKLAELKKWYEEEYDKRVDLEKKLAIALKKLEEHEDEAQSAYMKRLHE